MSSSSRHMFAVFALLFLFFSIFSLHSYYYENREQVQPIWFKVNKYPLNASEITLVMNKNLSVDGFALQHSAPKKEKSTETNIENVQPGTVHNGDRSKSSYSGDKCSCSKKNVKMSETDLPLTGLVSFPGSGNTWTRHLIQQMTGIGTSSIYCDGGLRSHGFQFECENEKAKTIIVKTHSAISLSMFKKIVLLVRNPYDTLLSFSNFATAGHIGTPSKKVLKQTSTEMFNRHLRHYANLILTTIRKFKGPVHVLQYERLKTDMANELRSLATFLNANVTGHDIDCTVKCQEGNFHRQTSDAQHLDLLRSIYDKKALLRLWETARTSEKVLKEAYNVSLDLGSSVENKTFMK